MSIKKKIKQQIKWTHVYQYRNARKYFSNPGKHFEELNNDEKSIKKKVIYNRNKKCKQLVDMLDCIDIKIRIGNTFQTWIDTGLYACNVNSMTDNTSPNYELVLDNSIHDLKRFYKERNGDFYENQYLVLKAIERYVLRVVQTIDQIIEQDDVEDANLKRTRRYFERMLTEKAQTLEEALQRILFWSSLFWQSQHMLVGLGRLDKLLDNYINETDDTVELLKEFLKELHRYYAFKSGPVSLGDTGQIIILGGLEKNGSYFCNALTKQFIIAMKECGLPDPKILLRVANNTPEDLLRLAVECIQTGIGCPLLANDEVIIAALIDFGYDEEDAYNYVTSACWEPLAYGKSLEKNNLRIINFAQPLIGALSKNNIEKIKDFSSLMNVYKNELGKHVDELLIQLMGIQWEENPLMSLFVENCFDNGIDISKGGAKYSDYGVLSVGLSNAIDALMNVKELSFEQKRYSLKQLVEAANVDFAGFESMRKELANRKNFGKDEESVIKLTKEVVDTVASKMQKYKNPFNGRVKFGLSSSNYVEASEKTSATLDGRKGNEPLRAHITAPNGVPFTELMNFAASLEYDDVKSNGNVIDFFVSPMLLQDNLDKFVLFLKSSIERGFFEMQMNVVDSATLIEAKNNPEEHQNLIVRVWGFSAYFNDLPESYKDVLIERALHSEGIVQ